MRVHARLFAVVTVTFISMGIIKGENTQVSGTQVRPGLTVVINFAELARLPVNSRQPSFQAVPFLTIREAEVPAAPAPIAVIPSATDAIAAPTAASPSPLLTFEALPDSYAVGTMTSYIPPDTHGAVGLDRIMVVLNNNVAILNKATGARLSTVSLNTFWASTGATGCFDPKVVYDPYNNRWIFVTLSNAQTSSSSLCIGVSATSDPSGSWYLTRFTVGTATLWGDFPCIGFNRNWIAVSINMFTITGDVSTEGRCLVLNYPNARGGTFTGGTIFTGIVSGGFCLHPAVTYSATQDTLFLVSHLSSAGRTYMVSRITGVPATPALTMGGTSTSGLAPWTQANGSGSEVLPQSPEPAPGTGTRKVDVGDSQIRSRVVYRNGNLYYSQTVGLPAGGTVTRTGAQWVRVGTTGTFLEGGRVEDPTATATNGGKWYAYSSIDVNAFGDILLGFSQFSSAQWPSTGYTFKARGDAVGTMRDPLIFKSGADYYEKDFGSGLNRWGDFSATQTDPSDDYHFWTIQEHSQTRVGTGNGSGRWGTWWAKVEPIDPLPIQLASFRTTMVSQNIVDVSWRTLTEENNYGFEVQKSPGSPWEYHTIPNSFVPGHGTTNVPQDYSFRDTTGEGGTWYYRLKQMDLDGTVHFYEGAAVDFPTGVSTEQLPVTLALRQNYPNPFNPTTVISYQLPAVSNARLVVYDLLGREVAVLVDGKELAGIHEVKFDARDLASGVYLYRLYAGIFVQTREMVLLK